MLFRIDPELSVLWRTPTEVQIGAPEPVAVVEVEDDWGLQVLDLLRVGVAPKRLRALLCEPDDAEASARLDRMLARVERALSRRSSRSISTPSVFVGGDARLAARLGQTLTELGVVVARNTADAQLTVLAAHFVVRPEWVQPLMSADIPHLAVLFDDRQVRVSPLVLPGRSSCLFCLESQQRDHDAQWQTVAVQLLRRRGSSADSPLALSAAAELATRLFDVACARPFANELVTIRPYERLSAPVPLHPNCACHSLPENVTVLVPRARPSEPSSPEVTDALA